MCLYVLIKSTESLRSGAEAGSRNCLGIRDCIVCRSLEEEPPATPLLVIAVDAEAPPKDSEELPKKHQQKRLIAHKN